MIRAILPVKGFRRWLSDKLSRWSVLVHPESEKAEARCREFFNKLHRDQWLYGNAAVRLSPMEFLREPLWKTYK